jgi:uncharacterized protein
MKKTMKAFLLVLSMLLLTALPAFAAEPPTRLVDGADLLTQSEEETVLAALDEVSAKYGNDVVVVTTDALGGKSPMAYADDFYDQNGYAEDGILLLISMEDRDWWISTCGDCISYFSDAAIDKIGEEMLSDLSSGTYWRAFLVFANRCEYYIDGGINGFPFPFGRNLIICLVVGFVVAFVATAAMKAQLKSVRQQNAGDYVKKGSMQLTDSGDYFMYRRVVRTALPKNDSSSTHSSSSGRSHGGGGGKF